MGRKAIVLVCAALLVFSVYSMCGAADGPVKLKFANFFPPTHKNAVVWSEFTQEMNKKSGGKLEISYYPGGTLLTAPKMAAGVATGIIFQGKGDGQGIGVAHLDRPDFGASAKR